MSCSVRHRFCPAVGIDPYMLPRFVPLGAPSAVVCAGGPFIGAVPQFAIVAPDLRRACTATSPRDLASSALPPSLLVRAHPVLTARQHWS
jgi:hypothetical protein